MKPEGGASCCEATLGERQTQAQNGQGGAHRKAGGTTGHLGS